MTLNPNADQSLILARIKTQATPATEEIGDLQTMPRFTNQKLRPIIEVDFGAVTASATSRTFAEEWAQPQDGYFFVTVYAGEKAQVRSVMGHLMRPGFLVGWSPSINCSAIWGGGGGSGGIEDAVVAGATIWYQRATFRFRSNLALQSNGLVS